MPNEKMSPQQFKEFLALAKSKKTRPEDLDAYAKSQGRGGITNASEILKYARNPKNARNPISGVWAPQEAPVDVAEPEITGDTVIGALKAASSLVIDPLASNLADSGRLAATGFTQGYFDKAEALRKGLIDEGPGGPEGLAIERELTEAARQRQGINTPLGTIAPLEVLGSAALPFGSGVKTLKGLAAVGGAYGGIAGSGYSDADNAKDLAKDTLVAGVAGATAAPLAGATATVLLQRLPAKVASWWAKSPKTKAAPHSVKTQVKELSELEQDLTLLAEKGLTESHFNSLDELKAAAKKIKASPQPKTVVEPLEQAPEYLNTRTDVLGSIGPNNSSRAAVEGLSEATGDVPRPGPSRPIEEVRQAAKQEELTFENFQEKTDISDSVVKTQAAKDFVDNVYRDYNDVVADKGLFSPEAQALSKTISESNIVDDLSAIAGDSGQNLSLFQGALRKQTLKEYEALVEKAKTKPKLAAKIEATAKKFKGDPDAHAKTAAELRSGDVLDLLTDIRMNAMLSSPKTLVANTLGYTSAAVEKIVRDPLGITVDKAVGPVLDKLFSGGKDAAKLTYKGSVASLVSPSVGGQQAILKTAFKAMRQGFTSGQSKDHLDFGLANRGRTTVGKWQIPRKLMAAQDEFARVLIEGTENVARAEAYAAKAGLKGKEASAYVDDLIKTASQMDRATARKIAVGQVKKTNLKGGERAAKVKELMDANTAFQLRQGVDEYSRSARFQDPTWIGKTFNELVSRSHNIQNSKTKGTDLVKWAAQQQLPFLNTTINLLNKGAKQYSPVALFHKDNWQDLARGGVSRQRALGNYVVGTSIGGGVYSLAAQGRLTAGAPTTGAERDKNELLKKPEYSYLADDGKWYSYKGLDPFSTQIAAIAALVNNEEGSGPALADFGREYLKNSGLGSTNVLSIILSGEPGERQAETLDRVLADQAASFTVPAIARDISDIATGDPLVRDLKGESFTDRFANQLKRGYGFSKDLPAKADIFGQDIKKPELLGPDFLSRIAIQDPNSVDLDIKELIALEKTSGKSIISKQDKGELEKISDLTQDELRQYQKAHGEAVLTLAKEVKAQPGWKDLTEVDKAKQITSLLPEMRKQLKAQLFPSEYGEPEKQEVGTVSSAEVEAPGESQRVIKANTLAEGLIRYSFPDLPGGAVTSTHRGTNHVLSKAARARGYTSDHEGYDAVDIEPQAGITYEEFLAKLESDDIPVLRGRSKNEVGKGKSAIATGDHWHIVIDTSQYDTGE